MTAADRGQAFTLEGFVAALVLLSSVVFALQMTAVTPLSPSTSSQHLEGQQAAVAAGLLDQAAANGSLRPALLYWNESTGGFHGASAKGYYTSCTAPLAFGVRLDRAFTDRGVACNVQLRYVTATGSLGVERLVYAGTPTDDAVLASATVTLYDDDVLYGVDGRPTGTTLANATTFYAPDADPGSPVYNVVQVQVIAWRM